MQIAFLALHKLLPDLFTFIEELAGGLVARTLNASVGASLTAREPLVTLDSLLSACLTWPLGVGTVHAGCRAARLRLSGVTVHYNACALMSSFWEGTERAHFDRRVASISK